MFSSFSSLMPNFGGHSNGDKKGQVVPTQQPFTPDEDDEEESKQLAALEDKNAQGPSSKKSASETFIFVRPPPSKTNHPLNLQVQLVPPKTRPPVGVDSPNTHALDSRKSIDSINPSDTNTDLTRISSNRSDTGYTSTASFSSTTSTASNASSRRTIIPLYSLQAHNVLTNVIVDAGTDARIARFTKRGMDFAELAVLEPIEVWPASANHAGLPPTAKQNPSVDGLPGSGRNSLYLSGAAPGSGLISPGPASSTGHHPGQQFPDLTPSSSRHSISSAGHSQAHSQIGAVPAVAVPPSPIPESPPAATTPKRNIFGKLFNSNKAKDKTHKPSTSDLMGTSSMPSIALPSESPQTTPTNSPVPDSHFTGHARVASVVNSARPSSSLAVANPVSKRHSIVSLAPSPPSPSPSRIDLPHDSHTDAPGHLVPGSSGVGPPLLRPVLGIHPALSCASYPPPPGSRPSMYVWHVRRWLKGGEGGLLGGVIGKLGSLGSLDAINSGGVHGPGALVEVRFEWKRGKASSKKRQRRVAGAPQGSPAGSKGPSRRTSVNVDGGDMTPTPHSLAVPDQEQLSAKDKKANRLSTLSQGSGSVNGHDFGATTPTPGGSGFGSGPTWQDDEAGNDSDPEDSETPWTCTLKVRRLKQKSSKSTATKEASSRDSKDKDPVLRVKIGTLSPTPHHPKVVSMLKVPFPLPDIAVDAVEARRRDVGPGAGGIRRAMAAPGHAHASSPGSPGGNNCAGVSEGEKTKAEDEAGLWLTAEEIKDVVCCTGLWVVVREGFGGLGKVRKGDGWKLRG